MNRNSWRLFLSVLFLSLSLLVFEVSLTRIFSIVLTYHYVFVVISFALLGLGLGGIVFHVLQDKTGRSDRWGLVGFTGCTVSFPVVIYLLVTLPLTGAGGFSDLRFYAYLLLANLPFLFGGMGLTWVFRKYAGEASIVYAADLTGAAIGALLAWLLLQWLGGVGASLVGGLSAGAATLLLPRAGSRSSLRGLVTLLPAGSFVYFMLGLFPAVPVGANPDKDLYRISHDEGMQPVVTESRWSAFGRTDMLEDPSNPYLRMIFTDGAAGSMMIQDANTLPDSIKAALLHHWGLQLFPFAYLKDTERNNMLIIGPGGGKDVFIAKLAGVGDITAVEVNPDIVSLVREYGKYNGGIYSNNDSTHILVGDGRNYLRNSTKRYDLIMLSIPITKSRRGYEDYSLTEDFLFTVQAFREYLEHLTPEGRIIIIGHGKNETIRLINTVLRTLEEEKVSNEAAMQQLYTVSDGMMALLVVKKSAFTPEEARVRHQGMHTFNFTYPVTWFPYIPQRNIHTNLQNSMMAMRPMFDQTLVYIANDIYGLDGAFMDYPVNVTPVTDDQPFFYDFRKGLPPTIHFLAFLFTTLLLFLFWESGRRFHSVGILGEVRPSLFPVFGVFAGLGMGYMITEIALFQKILPFFSTPTLALSVLLATLLAGTGTGSFLSRRIRQNTLMSALALVLPGVGILLVFSSLLFRWLPVSNALPVRGLLVLLLYGTGILMGYPFPSMMRYLDHIGLRRPIPWCWGINGVASVTGSVLAVILAKWFGWSYALLAAGLVYLGILLLVRNLSVRTRAPRFLLPAHPNTSGETAQNSG